MSVVKRRVTGNGMVRRSGCLYACDISLSHTLTGSDGTASTQSRYVPPKDVHEYCFRYVIGVVASHYLVHPQQHSSSVQSLAAKNTTEGAVVLSPYTAESTGPNGYTLHVRQS